MKKTILFFMFLMVVFSKAQLQDLENLASGEMVRFQAVFDNDDKLFGYFVLYVKDKQDEKNKKFEYVVLDKNLNKVSSKEFLAEEIVTNYYAYINRQNEFILYPYNNQSNLNFIPPKYKQIDIKAGTISDKIFTCYEDNAFKDCIEDKTIKQSNREQKQEIKDKGFYTEARVRKLEDGSYVVSEYNQNKKFINGNSVKYFDKDKNLLWEYKYNTNGDKKNQQTLFDIDIDEKAIYAILRTTQNKDTKSELLVFDISNGKILAQKPILAEEIEDNTVFYTLAGIDYYYPTFKKVFGDKIVFAGYNFDKYYQRKGFLQIIVDKNNYEVKINSIDFMKFKGMIPKIDRMGCVETGYCLNLMDAYFLKDGSIGLLTEKFKVGYSNIKTRDMVYIILDKNFQPKEVKILEKEKSVGSYTDFLFSQYLNNDNDVVFFYKDFQKDDQTKDKNWILFINTLINGKFNQEQIKISSKDDKFYIIPYVAKEGYILLREYNEKEKYNQIRLEKLNY